MTSSEYETIFNDLGLDDGELGLIARKATIAYCESLKTIPQGCLPCVIGAHYDGYYQALRRV